MFRPVEAEAVAAIVDAIEAERIRLGMSSSDVDRGAALSDNDWTRNARKKRLSLGRLIRVCKALDIEINLVNREGVNIL